MKLFAPALFALAAADQCANDCWQWDEAKQSCVLSNNAACFNVQCGADAMKVTFEGSLFNSNKDAFMNAVEPQTLRSNLASNGGSGFNLNCMLGECGMNVECEELQGPNDTQKELYLVFGTSVCVGGSDASKFVWKGTELVLDTGASRMCVDFKCAYKAAVTLNTVDEFTVNSWEIDDRVVQTGNLGDGFSIDLFTNPQATSKLEPGAALLVGSTVYAQVNWAITTLANELSFFVESVDLEMNDGGNSFPLIDGTCYSNAFGVTQMGNRKVVDTSAMFGFKTFISGRGAKNMSINLKACIKVCKKYGAFNCESQIAKTNNMCPMDAQLQYIAGRTIYG